MKLGISLEEAQSIIIDRCSLLPVEEVSMLEAVGRVCAIDITADRDLPAGPQSAVDGYAVGDGGHGDSGIYTLKGSFLLGEHPAVLLEPGEAWGVATGGDLPPGTAAVFPKERSTVEDGQLIAQEPFKPGTNIKTVGEDFTTGEPLIGRNTRITPGAIAVLAAFGHNQVLVYRRPRVALASISTNLIPWHMAPDPGQTRDCNIPLMTAMVIQNGGLVPVSLTNDGDIAPAPEVISALLADADILILIGGSFASAGNEAALLMEGIGADLLYWDVEVQPGSHTGASLLDGRLVLALSGNPAASGVGFQLFAVPALRAMQGLNPEPVYVKACCRNGFPKKSGSRRFIRGKVDWDGGWNVTVQPGQKPSMIRSLVGCNALIDIPGGSPPIEVGQEVTALLLNPYFDFCVEER